jgi:predicted Fe-S protein YdhL (DUF1289 family)
MGDEGLCTGCFRTLEEIATWGAMDETRRLQVVSRLDLRRKQSRNKVDD